MAHHAYLYVGGQEQGIRAARLYASTHLGLSDENNPDIAVFAYEGLFPVDAVRRVQTFAQQAPKQGDQKLIILAAGRLFIPAQNAFLKLFEEPTEGTTIILIVPARGILLPTVLSRLIELPREVTTVTPEAKAFIEASPTERQKLVAKIVARGKSDKDEEKQAVRVEAVHICEGLIHAAYTTPNQTPEIRGFLSDLSRFMPILHTSSAPLKLIFEHILIVMPEGLGK